MKKSNKTRKMRKHSGTIWVVLAAMIVTIGLSMAGAKMILSGAMKEDAVGMIACGIAAITAALCAVCSAARAARRKLMWGMVGAIGCVGALLIGNLLFFGDRFEGVLSIFLSCLVGGLLGSLPMALKR